MTFQWTLGTKGLLFVLNIYIFDKCLSFLCVSYDDNYAEMFTRKCNRYVQYVIIFIIRSSRLKVFYRTAILKYFTRIRRKTLAMESCFWLATSLKIKFVKCFKIFIGYCVKNWNCSWFSGLEILRKRTVFAEFWAICPKLRRNCFFTKFLHQEIRWKFGILWITSLS